MLLTCFFREIQHGAGMTRVWIGIGSNLGDRQAHIQKALTLLRSPIHIHKISSIYETPALLPEGAAEAWNQPFLNLVLEGETHLQPLPLLRELKAIETALGRKNNGYWAPREIDLDILLYANLILETPDLTIPHPQMLKRDFVLKPLAEIAGDIQHPIEGRSIREIASCL